MSYLKLIENVMFDAERNKDARWDSYQHLVPVLQKYGFKQEPDSINDEMSQWHLYHEHSERSFTVRLEDNILELGQYEQGNSSGLGGVGSGEVKTDKEDYFIQQLEVVLKKYNIKPVSPVTTPEVPTENTIQESKKASQDWGDTYQKLVNDQLKRNSEPLVKQMEERKDKKEKKPYKVGFGWFGFAGNELGSDGNDE